MAVLLATPDDTSYSSTAVPGTHPCRIAIYGHHSVAYAIHAAGNRADFTSTQRTSLRGHT